jgi:hypothetical protein
VELSIAVTQFQQIHDDPTSAILISLSWYRKSESEKTARSLSLLWIMLLLGVESAYTTLRENLQLKEI